MQPQVGRLLSEKERAERDGDPDTRGRTSDETGSWPCRSTGQLPRGPEPIDHAGAGPVAYYLVTGRPPFSGASAMAVLVAHARDPVVPPSLIRTGTREDLERVVLRCLAKDAANRFSDAESLERALGECACSGDWDQDRAARWWRDEGRISQPHTAAAAL